MFKNKEEVDDDRYDFMLQEKSFETVSKTYALLYSHTSYWTNKDVANFVLKKIHN